MFKFVVVFMSLFVLSPSIANAEYDPAIRQAQQKLYNLGYQPGPIDGYWGKRTANAIKSYQRNQRISESGRLDMPTRDKLGIKDFNSTTKQKGNSCSGLMKPDTNIGGKIAAVSEVSNEETASIFLDRI